MSMIKIGRQWMECVTLTSDPVQAAHGVAEALSRGYKVAVIAIEACDTDLSVSHVGAVELIDVDIGSEGK